MKVLRSFSDGINYHALDLSRFKAEMIKKKDSSYHKRMNSLLVTLVLKEDIRKKTKGANTTGIVLAVQTTVILILPCWVDLCLPIPTPYRL